MEIGLLSQQAEEVRSIGWRGKERKTFEKGLKRLRDVPERPASICTSMFAEQEKYGRSESYYFEIFMFVSMRDIRWM